MSFLRVTVTLAALALALTVKPIIVPYVLSLNLAPADDRVGAIPILPVHGEGGLSTHFDGRAALVIGGTRGVGLGTAIAMARAGADVTVAGRSAESGRAAVERLEEAARVTAAARSTTNGGGDAFARKQKFRFVRGDIGSVRSANDLVDSLSGGEQKFDYLVVTAAVFPDWVGSLQQEDSLDCSVAVAVVGRYMVYKNMYRFLNFDGIRPPRVLNVLASGMNPPKSLDREIVSGRHNVTTLFESLMTWGLANELMLIGMQENDPNMGRTTMVSTHPGFIRTDLHRGQGMIPSAIIWAAIAVKGISLEEAGLRQASVLASERRRENSLTYVDFRMKGRSRSERLQREVDVNLPWLWSFLQGTTKAGECSADSDTEKE